MTDDSGPVRLNEPLETLARSPELFAHNLRFPPADRIRVYDDTLRDGEQTPGVAFSPDTKYEIARRLSDIGVHCMDVGFPAVSPTERETLGRILEGRRRGELREDLEIACLMRAARSDIETTVRCVERFGFPPDSITYVVFTSGSDLHVKYKLGRSLLQRDGLPDASWLERPLSYYREANLRLLGDGIRFARSLGASEIEYGAEDGSRADLDYLIALHQAGQAAGGTRNALTDTVGSYSPYAVHEDVARVRAGTPDLPFGLHFHNDLGLAAWNTVVGLGSGADYFMTSVNGLGERTGNAPMHQVLMQLRYLFGIELPGFKYEKLRELARFVERVSGVMVQPTEPGIGFNVFSHESGIHTAGMRVHPSIYQFIPPEHVGAETEFVYGKHSGAMSVELALRQAGLDSSPETVKAVLTEIKRIREERAQDTDYAAFRGAYYDHVAGLGIPIDDVVELGRALSARHEPLTSLDEAS
jgi:isopropylmalate/homocitrate/citramalate synthase